MTTGPVVRVAAICQQGDELLLVRSGHGPAAGTWSVPATDVSTGELLAEAVVRAVEDQTGATGLCGPFIGWAESIDDASHAVTMYFDCVLLDGAPAPSGPVDRSGVAPEQSTGTTAYEPPPDAERTAVEQRSVPTWDVCELRLAEGLAEFLADHGIIDTVV